MSAFGGKADMTFCENPLSRSLLGAKRTCPFALHMSANDPKRTLIADATRSFGGVGPWSNSKHYAYSRKVQHWTRPHAEPMRPFRNLVG